MAILDSLSGGNIPKIELTGFFSNTWVYVLILAVVGFIFILTLATILFFFTYKRKVVIFENISGQGYQPIIKTRARVIAMTGTGNDKIMKTLVGNLFLTAYGKKMGKNTYWFAIGSDGFPYNFTLGDLDTKKNILDIDPIDRDIRGFQVLMDRRSIETYMGRSVLEKYGVHILLFVFLVVMILGLWFIVAKIGEATQPLAASNEVALKVQESNLQVTSRLDAIARSLGYKVDQLNNNSSGLEQA